MSILPSDETVGNLSLRNREIICLSILLFTAFLVRFILFPLKGNTYDMAAFETWINSATTHGLRSFYDIMNWCDYPPFSACIFWGFGNLAKLLGFLNMASINDVVKSIPTFFDLATVVLIYVFVRKELSFKWSLATAAIYAFNPAVIYNVAVWGQFDAVYTFFLVLSLVLALKNKPKLAAAAIALGILTKPQAIALAPMIAFLIYKKNGLKTFTLSLATFALTFILVILPFDWTNPVTFLSNIYLGGYGNYKFTSVNAFNIWGLVGFFKPDGYLFILGWCLFAALVVYVLYIADKRFATSDKWFIVFGAFMLLFGFFMLDTRIHERYLFPALSMLALTVPFIKKARPIYIILTGTLLLNQAYILYSQNNNLIIPSRNWISILGITVNIIALVYAIALTASYRNNFRNLNGNPPSTNKNAAKPRLFGLGTSAAHSGHG